MGFVDDTLSLMESWGVGPDERKAFVRASRWKQLDDLGLDERQSNALSCTFASLLLRLGGHLPDGWPEMRVLSYDDLKCARLAVIHLMVAAGHETVFSQLSDGELGALEGFVTGCKTQVFRLRHEDNAVSEGSASRSTKRRLVPKPKVAER